MKVKELIELLKKEDPDNDVAVRDEVSSTVEMVVGVKTETFETQSHCRADHPFSYRREKMTPTLVVISGN